MKLLFDENLSRRLVPFLQHDYPGSSPALLRNRDIITESLMERDLASVEIVPA